MNKKISSKLSSSEREMLSLIDSRFVLAEQLLGFEPAIYFEFDVKPKVEKPENAAVTEHRQALFNNLAAVKSKKD